MQMFYLKIRSLFVEFYIYDKLWCIQMDNYEVGKYMWLQTHGYRTNNALYGTLQSSDGVPGRPND
jgi:hypothetical protein